MSRITGGALCVLKVGKSLQAETENRRRGEIYLVVKYFSTVRLDLFFLDNCQTVKRQVDGDIHFIGF